MTKWETMPRDLTLDVKAIRNTVEQGSRFQLAMQAVHETVSRAQAENMCLAGHSLGSALALLAGKNMAKMGFYLETYLFNPPFIAVPIEMMTKTQILKHGVRVTRSVMTAGVAIALDGLHQRPDTEKGDIAYIMAFQNQMFDHSGPLYLTAVDWNNPHHRRSVAASLVQGVYSLEHDRLENREWHQALAPLWGDFFNFKLFRSLVDNADHSIFGVIYEFKSPPPSSHRYNPCQSPPRYVVALRGTMTERETRLRDLTLDIKVIRNTIEQDTRLQLAMQAVRDMVSIAGAANIWLAGHSLGSAMALLAGKNMAKEGSYLETYLFNPPFIAVPIEMTIETEILKHVVHFMRSVMTAGVAIALHGLHQRPQTGDWAKLSRWIPYLFVNPFDPISIGYVEYFKQREYYMAEIGGAAAAIESLAASNTISGARQPLHLLPSGYLTTNASPDRGFRHAHGLQQWWRPNIQCQSRLHQYFR
ncbi:hypothetical protein RHSIM_Rhsim02G0183900 [Rhododendron simsii]|uniref:Fungal lipase-type domain-containing protein n=1 Tax=Rhododendron simsii TaxID=118357 RepID=A0A834HD49_RHOSS|nr:hypothetical protein RHSIM_Rhsim02G0183900 [Rhododendron simsii]